MLVGRWGVSVLCGYREHGLESEAPVLMLPGNVTMGNVPRLSEPQVFTPNGGNAIFLRDCCQD